MSSKGIFNYGNEILFSSLLVLVFAPHDYKLPGLGIVCFCLIAAAIIDFSKNNKRVRRITRRVASCSCVKAKERISHMQMPQLLPIDCTVCGAKAS